MPKPYPEGVYHERQSRELCAMHALNNLFQQRGTFTKQHLDDICQSLSPESSALFNPHRSMIGLGNYDVNVIMAALQLKNCDTLWFDKRKNVDQLNLPKIKGFILNIPTNLTIGFIHIPIPRKHWIAVRKVDSFYYSFDSKLNNPDKIGDETDLKTYLKEQISSKEKEVLVVVEKDIGSDSIWLEDECKDSDHKSQTNQSDTVS